MLKALRELGEFALSIVSDCVEMLGMLQVPTIASSTRGIDRMKALQLSAFICIVLLVAWSATGRAGEAHINPVSVAILTAIYVSFSAWIMHVFLDKVGEYVTNSELKSDATTVILAFNLIVILIATIISEIDLYLFRHQPNILERWDFTTNLLLLLSFPAFAAGGLALLNSIRYTWSGSGSSRGTKKYIHIGAFLLINILLSNAYIYFIFIRMLYVES